MYFYHVILAFLDVLHKLLMYFFLKCIHEWIAHYEKPLLVLVPFEDLVKLSADKFIRPVYGQKSSSTGSVVETYVVTALCLLFATMGLFLKI